MPQITENNRLVLEDMKLVMPFRRFAGDPDRGGARSFAIQLPDDVAQDLEAQGIAVKHTDPERVAEGYDEMHWINVKLSAGPDVPHWVRILLVDKEAQSVTPIETTDPNQLAMLDSLAIDTVDAELAVNHYNVQGHKGINLYVNRLYVVLMDSARAAEYNAQFHEASPLDNKYNFK